MKQGSALTNAQVDYQLVHESSRNGEEVATIKQYELDLVTGEEFVDQHS